MYNVSFYGTMIADGPRIDAYVAALKRAVTPGSVVIDLGSGPGFFALLACRLGASHVYAIEPGDVIEIARRAASANGFADRVTCIQELSMNVELPEKADVIVSDLRGILPWFQQHLPSIQDARKRFLKPGGRLIPQRDFLWSALVSAPEKYEELVSVWNSQRYDLDFTAGRTLVVNSWSKYRAKQEQLLVEPLLWHTIDYPEVTSADVQREMSWGIAVPGTAHGVLIWFDTELDSGIGFSNHPAEPELVYGSAFFPFSEPLILATGDKVTVTIQADLVERDYVWRWATRVSGAAVDQKKSFTQSSFYSVPLSKRKLHKRAASFVPSANDDGKIAAFVLSRMDGKAPISEIARQLAEQFPERFADQQKALNTVSELSQKYSNDPATTATPS
jgi:protein arginine N-methyltransferase 1